MYDLSRSFSRRRLLASGAAATLLGSWRPTLRAADSPSPTADLLIPGKDRRLVVHKADPLEIETPLELLRDAPTTPAESLFVRNNFQPDWAATLNPPDAER